MRDLRDADVHMPYSEFRRFMRAAVGLDPAGEFAAADDTAELRRLLAHQEEGR